jgi:hypothetical protein
MFRTGTTETVVTAQQEASHAGTANRELEMPQRSQWDEKSLARGKNRPHAQTLRNIGGSTRYWSACGKTFAPEVVSKRRLFPKSVVGQKRKSSVEQMTSALRPRADVVRRQNQPRFNYFRPIGPPRALGRRSDDAVDLFGIVFSTINAPAIARIAARCCTISAFASATPNKVQTIDASALACRMSECAIHDPRPPNTQASACGS